jgi:hypothetical protein
MFLTRKCSRNISFDAAGWPTGGDTGRALAGDAMRAGPNVAAAMGNNTHAIVADRVAFDPSPWLSVNSAIVK